MANNEKGSKENPYSWSEYSKMLDDGTWKGGYVKDDAGKVAYAMADASCVGYSGSGSGSSGSDFEFSTGSYEWHYPDTETGSDDNGKQPGTGNEGGTGTGGNMGGGWSGGGTGSGGYRPGVADIHNGKQGTYLYGAPYYTEKEYEQMCKKGTWTGGNVYTLGYIGRDCVLPSCLTPIDPNDDWLTLLKDKASDMRDALNQMCKQVMSLSYVQAVARYNSGTGAPLYLDASALGLENIGDAVGDVSEMNGVDINFLDLKTLHLLLSGRTTSEQIKTLSTALTLGNVHLSRQSGNRFSIEMDKYDFDMHKWSEEPWRNTATVLGHLVCEGLCIGADALDVDAKDLPLLAFPLGLVIGRSFDVAAGLVRRHVKGETEFKIFFTGTMAIGR